MATTKHRDAGGLTRAQRNRQRYREGNQYGGGRGGGRYAKVNPCYVCDKSAGEDYYSHPGTDVVMGDALLCICARCAKATDKMKASEALVWANARRTKLGLGTVCSEGYIADTRINEQIEEEEKVQFGPCPEDALSGPVCEARFKAIQEFWAKRRAELKGKEA